ncbi:hypothetical protein QQF64_010206 [Cirrhinus molitorella]|uniref:Uncharacterized protein n=1 Tax=Cirrhinus molitorella TaxID=172907 RepID=A0ABR3M6G5_9TELE
MRVPQRDVHPQLSPSGYNLSLPTSKTSLCGPVNNSKVKHLLLNSSLQGAKREREIVFPRKAGDEPWRGRCSCTFACVSSLREVPKAPAVSADKLLSTSSWLPTAHQRNRATTVSTHTHNHDRPSTCSKTVHTAHHARFDPHTPRLPWLPNYLSVPTHRPVRNVNKCSAEARLQLFDSNERHTCNPATIMIRTQISLRP